MLVNALLAEWEVRNVVCLVEYPFLGPRQNRDLNAYSKKRYYDYNLVTASSGKVEYVFAMRPVTAALHGAAGGYQQVKPLFMIEAKRRGDFDLCMQGQVLVEGYLATVQHHIVDHLDNLITDTQHQQFTGPCVMATDSSRYIFYRVVRDTIQGELVTWRSRVYNINAPQDLLLILSIAHSCIASRWLGVYPGLNRGADFGGPAPALVGGGAATPAQVRQWNDQRPPDDPNRLSGSAIVLPANGLVDDYITAHTQELAQADRT